MSALKKSFPPVHRPTAHCVFGPWTLDFGLPSIHHPPARTPFPVSPPNLPAMNFPASLCGIFLSQIFLSAPQVVPPTAIAPARTWSRLFAPIRTTNAFSPTRPTNPDQSRAIPTNPDHKRFFSEIILPQSFSRPLSAFSAFSAVAHPPPPHQSINPSIHQSTLTPRTVDLGLWTLDRGLWTLPWGKTVPRNLIAILYSNDNFWARYGSPE